jgi:hypothetical protein
MLSHIVVFYFLVFPVSVGKLLIFVGKSPKRQESVPSGS